MGEQPTPRHIMRTAMWAFYTGPDRDLLESHAQLERAFRSDDPGVVSQSRIVWMAMAKLALDGKVELTGHLERSSTAQPIEAGLLPSSHPDFQAQTLSTDVGTFYGVLVGAKAPASSSWEPAAVWDDEAPSDNRGKGGRPASYDWPAFRRELVRAVWEGGLPDRRAIRAHMVDWCKRWSPTPDERTIRDQLNPLLDASIPEKRGN